MTGTAPAQPQPPRARLLKVVVQPVFVMDDGENLTEVSGQPTTITASEWRHFGETAFGGADLEAIAAQFAAQSQGGTASG